MYKTEPAELIIYRNNGHEVLAPDTEDGRYTAAMDGLGCEPDKARPINLNIPVASLSDEQRHHLNRHGWCAED